MSGDNKICDPCAGSGFTDKINRHIWSMEPRELICRACGGRGWVTKDGAIIGADQARPESMLAVAGLDTSDAAAYALLEKIAAKAVEPMSDEADPNKTVGEVRRELSALLFEAAQFVATRNAS